ncbi:MAG: MmcQ/YjbR family DNA-binding protein [Myxococcales bacterium]|nr:MmcQ/YjbR family DNA-binding protein [Myxococcales bacterium]
MPKARTKGTSADTLRAIALAYPEAHEDFPWGESAFKVKKKGFLFMSTLGDELTLSVKLPDSGLLALQFPFVQPTGYGLGKSGWVTARFGPDGDLPIPMLHDWIDESYRAIAPTKRVAMLTPPGVPAKPKRPVSKRAPGRGRPQ